MKVVTLLCEKGGVGKTTLATHIAAGLAIHGRRVVLIDADPQGSAALLLGQAKAPGLYNLLIRDDDWQDVLMPIPSSAYSRAAVESRLWLLPGNVETRAIAAINPDPFLLRSKLLELDAWADVVVIDTSPTPSQLHTSIYLATDIMLMPTTPAYLSLDGLAASILHQHQAAELRTDMGLGPARTVGIVPTMYRSGTVAHDEALRHLLSTYKRLVWPQVPLRTVWEQAAMAGQMLFTYAPDDPTTAEAWALVERVEREIDQHG